MIISQKHYQNNLFSLNIAIGKFSTQIKMNSFTYLINTKDIPSTHPVLQKNLPGVLRSKCFNDQHLAFETEVQATELGHLFEHILLEYLCELKITQGFSMSKFSGVTEWNWKKDPKGVFHITINTGLKDRVILIKALEKTIQLTLFIMNTSIKSSSEFSIPQNSLMFLHEIE